MNLEDRIHDTGEHFLGRFEPAGDLPARISERVVADTRKRRQHAAIGLGAGVAAVIGGLITLNLARPSGNPPLSAGGSAGPTRTPVSSATLLSAPPTTLAAAAPVTSALQIETTLHAAASTPRNEPPPTPPALGEGRSAELDTPLLYTSSPDGASAATIDPVTGAVTGAVLAGGTAAGSSRAARGSLPIAGYVYSWSDEPVDDCAQHALQVTSGTGEADAGSLPDAGSQLAVDADGDVGVLLSSPCTTGDDAVLVLLFDPRDPEASPHELASVSATDLPAFVDVSADGSVAVLVTSRGATAFDLPRGTAADPLPGGCVSPVIDADHGWFVHDRIGISLAECDDVVTVLAGEPGAMEALARLPECTAPALLALDSSMRADPTSGWFAVADTDHHLAWVISGPLVFGPWEVGDWIRLATESG